MRIALFVLLVLAALARPVSAYNEGATLPDPQAWLQEFITGLRGANDDILASALSRGFGEELERSRTRIAGIKPIARQEVPHYVELAHQCSLGDIASYVTLGVYYPGGPLLYVGIDFQRRQQGWVITQFLYGENPLSIFDRLPRACGA